MRLYVKIFECQVLDHIIVLMGWKFCTICEVSVPFSGIVEEDKNLNIDGIHFALFYVKSSVEMTDRGPGDQTICRVSDLRRGYASL